MASKQSGFRTEFVRKDETHPSVSKVQICHIYLCWEMLDGQKYCNSFSKTFDRFYYMMAKLLLKLDYMVENCNSNYETTFQQNPVELSFGVFHLKENYRLKPIHKKVLGGWGEQVLRKLRHANTLFDINCPR